MSVSRSDLDQAIDRASPLIFDLLVHLINAITHSPDPEAAAKRALLEAAHDDATQEAIRRILDKR